MRRHSSEHIREIQSTGHSPRDDTNEGTISGEWSTGVPIAQSLSNGRCGADVIVGYCLADEWEMASTAVVQSDGLQLKELKRNGTNWIQLK